MSSCVTMGYNDAIACISGWYVRDCDGNSGVAFRCTFFPDAVVCLPLTQPVTRLVLLVSPLAGLTTCVELYDDATGEELGRGTVSDDCWQLLTVQLGTAISADELRLRVHTSTPAFVPDKYLHNGDFRPMGIRVAAIRVE